MSHRGGILELVARGKKDAFFHSNPKTSYFHSVYHKYTAFVEELHLTTPRNQPEWGRWCEFELEHRGDLVRKFHLRITLPTWLPPAIAEINNTSLIATTLPGGITFGYCNNVGYQMIDRIQVYQDQVLLQELYGEYLDWKIRQSVPLGTVLVMASSVGSRGDTAVEIGRSATAELRVPIPILGWENVGDPGFPTIALRNQRFRIRILLRPLEAVVVASDGRFAPKPWGTSLQLQRSPTASIETFETLPYEAVAKGINMMLETTQVYVPCDTQEVLKTGTWMIPYRSSQHQSYTIQDYQMNAASTAAPNFSLSFPLDFTGAATRIFAAFQQVGAIRAGQRGQYLANVARQMRVNVAGLDRIQPWSPAVFREVTQYWKSIRGLPSLEVFTFTFGGKESLQPAGTLSFSRAAIPDLWVLFGPTPIDNRTLSRELLFLVYLETWEVLEVKEGKGRVFIME